MSLISDLLVQARFSIGDMDQTKFSDYQLLEMCNAGNKLLRKIIMDNFPAMLLTTDSGTTAPTAALTKKAIRVNDVRIDGAKVNIIDLAQVPDKTAIGKPTSYQMTNLNTVTWYPIPDKEYQYEVSYIPESTLVDETMDSGYPAEIELLLVQFIVSKATGAETDVTTGWAAEINSILGNIEPDVLVVDGYY